MKHIIKQFQSIDLKEWVESNEGTILQMNGPERWDYFHKDKKAPKKVLQKHILDEQGHICAYCNCRIHHNTPLDDEQLRLDHVLPKDRFPELALSSINIIGSCFGGERTRRKAERSCETRKKNHEIVAELDPTNEICENNVSFDIEGMVTSMDNKLQVTLNTILGLNHAQLKRKRKELISGLIEAIDQDDIQPSDELERYMTKSVENKFEPYAGVLISFIKQNYKI
jgi:uncharacterized protein (TIGR02646 family)